MSVVEPTGRARTFAQRVHAFNALVRSFITLSVVLTFIYGFVWSQRVSGEIFTNIVILVVTWWFSQESPNNKPEHKETAPMPSAGLPS